MSSLFWLELGFLAGLTGVAGASLTVCACCRRPNQDLVATLTVLHDPVPNHMISFSQVHKVLL